MNHCKPCGVEFLGDNCWLCGGEGTPGWDGSAPWTNSMSSEPLIGSWERAERSAFN